MDLIDTEQSPTGPSGKQGTVRGPLNIKANTQGIVFDMFRMLLLLFALAITHNYSMASQETEDSKWASDFFPSGCDDRVLAMAEHPEFGLILGGRFQSCGGQKMQGVGSWDTDRFLPIANGINVGQSMGTVHAISVENTEGKIYIGGDFSTIDGVAATNFAFFDQGQWQAPLESGLNGIVRALEISPTGDLYAAGDFDATVFGNTIGTVARWNGTVWESLNVFPNGAVNDIAFDSNGRLCIVGAFTQINDDPYSRIACRNNDEWEPVGSGVSQTAYAVAFSDDNTLYVGGAFTDRLKRWDGEKLEAPDSPLNSGSVRTLKYADGSLYVGGTFGAIGQPIISPVGGIARLQDDQWDFEFPAAGFSGLSGRGVYAIGKHNETLYIGGFRESKDNIMALHDDDWVKLIGGADGTVNIVHYLANNNLLVGGSFEHIGGIRANGIAVLTDEGWRSLSGDLNSQGSSNISITQVFETGEGEIIATGNFTHIGLINAGGVARWTGDQWLPLGSGLPESNINGIITLNDGRLFFYGEIATAGSETTNNIAIWDGEIWETIPDGPVGPVFSAQQLPSGDIVMAGRLSGTFTSAPYVLSLSTTGQWTDLSGGLPSGTSAPRYRSLLLVDERLYLAGSRLHRFNGESWDFLAGFGTDAGSDATQMSRWRGRGILFATGTFGPIAQGLNIWNGEDISVVGSGISLSRINSISISQDGRIAVGGSFESAFGSPASRISIRTTDKIFHDRFRQLQY